MKSFKAHDDWISYLLFVDNFKLISCSADKKIKIWNSINFECQIELENHLDAIYYLDVTSDGRLLSCSEDKTIKIWQIKTGEMLESIQFEKAIHCFKILNDDLISVETDEDQIEIVNLNTIETIKTISSNITFVYCFHLLSNGNMLSGSQNGEIKLWKLFE